LRVAVPDLISPSYFPLIAAVELGFFEREGLDAEIKLVFPVTRTYEQLRDGELDYAGGAAHAPLYAFRDWSGCKLACALSQGMYWFLVVRSDLEAERGDLRALEGLRIGAAPGPVDGLREMLRAVGMDPDRDVEIGPVPGSVAGGVSFGVTAAAALAEGLIDGFWANGMGAEVAVEDGTGRVLVDARRGDGPAIVRDYTFPALVVTDERIAKRPGEVAAAVRAVIAAQEALRLDPSLALEAARRRFPPREQALIGRLIERDAPFYDHRISTDSVRHLAAFAHELGILSDPAIPRERVVASQVTPELLLRLEGGEVRFAPRVVIAAGYTGRDQEAVRAHVEELAAHGIAPPEHVPMLYPLPLETLSAHSGPDVSGEAEAVLLVDGEDVYVAVGSDHTDRVVEREDVLRAKRGCPKPISSHVWRLEDVAPHWDELELRSWVTTDGDRRLYQEGTLAALLPPDEILQLVRSALAELDGAVVFCGTLPLVGGTFAPDVPFEAELRDPVRGRSLVCAYNPGGES
jgi:ABC-type nitrate/sulfonate/bicarbonate transport system substrate-binding protein